MFFLFGWGRQTRKDFGPTLPIQCGNCRNRGFYRLLHVKKWFTLFFVPVIPYESHHFLLCDVCSRGFEVHGGQIDNAKQMSQTTAAYLGKQITEEQYKMALNQLRLLEDNASGAAAGS